MTSSRNTGRFFHSAYCGHEYPVYDRPTGTLVCPDCALVLDGDASMTEIPSYDLESSVIRFKLHDFCCNGNIPESIENDTLSFYNTIAKLPNYSEKEELSLLAFALYATLAQSGSTRSIQEISALTGVDVKSLWKIETQISVNICSENSIDYLDRFCYTLDIPRHESEVLRKIIVNFPILGSTNPQSITATAIYLFCKEFRVKRTLKTISHICGVSSITIRNTANKLNPIYKNKISLLTKL